MAVRRSPPPSPGRGVQGASKATMSCRGLGGCDVATRATRRRWRGVGRDNQGGARDLAVAILGEASAEIRAAVGAVAQVRARVGYAVAHLVAERSRQARPHLYNEE